MSGRVLKYQIDRSRTVKSYEIKIEHSLSSILLVTSVEDYTGSVCITEES